MRIVAAVAAVVLLLGGCAAEDPDEDTSESPTTPASPTEQPEEIAVAAVCEALVAAAALPGGGAVEYTVEYPEQTGWNSPSCRIEPDGEYYDVAGESASFGRAYFEYGMVPDEQLDQVDFPEYDPGAPEELLTLDQAEHLPAETLPCADEPCADGIHGYQYNFRFETVAEDITVIAEFDYITTDVSGELRPEYRSQAVAAFNASMEVILAELQ
ncbi:hypothetical protein L0U85_09555 [Glycomyces sp. L485]|uniref:hypothetical protein n=1 Tax=Glycomyces sp. L485 TaxID=2909235 RepID=UPI001F4ABB16|nr:hypothetical protein [Glycomyces sp. L485]MCH7231096.1 hypothetical protein [Glycomyces sp. L485]